MRRDLASRAVLIAAGVGTALGAGAGLANAAPLEHDLQQDQAGNNAFDQAAPTDAAGGQLPQAPNLPLTPSMAQNLPMKPLSLDSVSADQLAGLGTNGQLSGLGSQSGTADGAGSTDQASGATDQASGATDQASPSTDGASAPSASGTSSMDGSQSSGDVQGDSGTSGSGSGGYTTNYSS